jgi:hypothetical protein
MDSDEKQYRAELVQSNPEAWLELLDGLTMRSVLVPLPAAVTFREEHADAALVEALGRAVQAVGGRAFCRTSLRSPKDSTHAISVQKQFVREQLGGGSDDDNRAMILLLQGALRGMCVRGGAEAHRLLATSERVREDLARFRAECPSVVVREWLDIDPAREWRCFAVDGRVTAISQYYSTLFFPALLRDKTDDARLILETFGRDVWPRLQKDRGFARMVIDFVRVGDRAIVVELNPFSEATHACLFDWHADRKLLHGQAAAEAEVRVRESPLVLSRADKMVLADFLK